MVPAGGSALVYRFREEERRGPVGRDLSDVVATLLSSSGAGRHA